MQHPLDWIDRARAKGWDILLDAAAFTPTNQLDLDRWRPDFVVQSFYKIFGYPTGVGCLLARKAALVKLRRPWFAGGTITVASVQGDKHYPAQNEAAFEDGTMDYLALPAVEIGLGHIEAIGYDTIHERVRCLTGWLLDNLIALRHPNGQPLARVYGPQTTDRRGGTVTFNFYDAGGHPIDHRVVEERANAANISLRTGCFCNPGGGEIALGISGTELTSCFRQPKHKTHLTVDDFRLCIDGKSSGAVRVSLGLVSQSRRRRTVSRVCPRLCSRCLSRLTDYQRFTTGTGATAMSRTAGAGPGASIGAGTSSNAIAFLKAIPRSNQSFPDESIWATTLRTIRPGTDAGENPPSNTTFTAVSGRSRVMHLTSTPVAEMSTSTASPPTGDRRTPVIDGTTDAARRGDRRLSALGT